MSGMPFLQALLLAAAVMVVIVATQWRNLHPFLAVVVIASAFGLAVGLSVATVAKAFGNGFAQAVYSPGLVIIGAALVAGMAESAGVSDWFARGINSRPWSAPSLGLIAGLAASPAAAFAVLTPLVAPLAKGVSAKPGSAPTALALAMSGSHGLLLCSPVPIVAASILDASWMRVALFGLPVALLVVVFAAAWPRLWMSGDGVAGRASEPVSIAEKPNRATAIVLLLAIAVPLVMLLVQSLGDIPSEPLGGGPSRERVLALGRPLVLLIVGLGVMVIGRWRLATKLLGDSAWTARILGQVAGIVLIVGAAGGLQRLCQETGMAELLAERLLDWHMAGIGGLLVAFLVAATIKTLQGSSLVAVITAAGMVQLALTPLGLASDNARGLAALAIGAGAMTISHVNDEYFWLVSTVTGLRPLRGLAVVGLGTLLQGLIAAAALAVLFALVAGV